MRTIAPLLTLTIVLAGASAAQAQPASFVMAACGGETTRLADVTLPRPVMADGRPLPAGQYELRLTTQRPPAVPGLPQEAACWVQFVRDGVVAGRELATVIAATDISAVAKGPAPKRNGARVDLLKGGDYFRIWVDREGTNYIINVPPQS